jgi:endoribonuclease LACTB2
MQESRYIHRLAVRTPTLFPATSTNVYLIIHQGEGLIIDAGAEDEDSVKAITAYVEALGRPRVQAIILTHYHRDHSPGAKALSVHFQCPIWAHALEKENVEREIAPYQVDRTLEDGERIEVGGLQVQVIHTPGHTRGHLSLWLEEDKTLFVGDNAAGEGSVWVGPPDGDLALYLQSLQRLRSFHARRLAPGHGRLIEDADGSLAFLIERRKKREDEILRLLQYAPLSISQLVEQIYRDQIHPSVRWAAERTVEGHLIKLLKENRVQIEREGETVRYKVSPPLTMELQDL